MSLFGAYSGYYDLLYRDKDYAAEARYVAELIATHAPGARTILELGCGTGAHAAELAAIGYSVFGVDMSEGMLAAAATRASRLGPDVSGRLTFSAGDVRTVRLGRKFDSVISLFHVMSYQASNADLASAFATARDHLSPGGVFVFDCWYGPAVLTQKPAVAVKRLGDGVISVLRIAEPVMHATENIVDVNYTVHVTEHGTGKTEALTETHRMRYLFTPEIETALAAAGMTLIESREWMSPCEPGFDSWSACFVGVG